MMVTCLVSALSLGNLPFNVIQMLWINLVMDILAAIALGTSKDQSKSDGRYSRKFKVFEPEMWRQIIIQSIYQITVNLVLIYFGGLIFGKPYNLVTSDPRNEGKILIDTFIFNTFFWMTMFNQICSRVIDGVEMNVFRAPMSSIWFWLVWLAEVGIMVLMQIWSNFGVGAAILGMVPLDFSAHLISILIGAFSIVVHIIQLKIPINKFAELNDKIGLDKEGASNMVDGIFAKLGDRLKNEEEEDDDDY